MGKKRASGEGTVRKRPDGRWESRLSWVDPDTGERKRQSFYGATMREAREKLRGAQGRIHEQAPVTDSTMTVGQWLARWRETALRASDRAPSTKRLYADLSRLHIESSPLGPVRLDRLRPSEIEKQLVRLQEESGLSASTARSIYAMLRNAFSIAVRDGLLARSPMDGVQRPGLARTEVTKLSAEDVVSLLDATKDTRHHTLLIVIASTGLRKGEALGLRWSDVDLDAGHLSVSGTLTRVQGALIRGDTKTARSRRTVPLSPGVVAILRAHRTEQRAERMKATEWHDSDGLVFTTTSGRPMDPRNVSRTMERAVTSTGLAGANVHSLRHAAAATWMQQGVHIKAVSDLLGHSSITVTADTYGHTSDSSAKTAIDGLSSALGL